MAGATRIRRLNGFGTHIRDETVQVLQVGGGESGRQIRGKRIARQSRVRHD